MPPSTTHNPPVQFATAVADALKHYNDPLWLGQYSPLATPYFLGTLLQQEQQPESNLGRGHGLQHAIDKAAASIWPGELPQSKQGLLNLVEKERAEELYGPRYLFLLLDLRYGDQLPAEDPPLGDRVNMAYMNSSVTRGRGEMVVTDTGMATEMGHIAGMLDATEEEKAPLTKQVDRLTIRWPTGGAQTFQIAAANQRLLAVQGASELVPLERP